jgi:hypothetical protein
VIHRRTHPEPVEGCFGCKCLTVSVAPSATPSRHPGAAATVARDRQWDADMPAYARLRANGVQPPRIDGSAELESKATEKLQIEMGTPNADPKLVREGVRLSQDLGVA